MSLASPFTHIAAPANLTAHPPGAHLLRRFAGGDPVAPTEVDESCPGSAVNTEPTGPQAVDYDEPRSRG